jgi:hypothetical protein
LGAWRQSFISEEKRREKERENKEREEENCADNQKIALSCGYCCPAACEGGKDGT